MQPGLAKTTRRQGYKDVSLLDWYQANPRLTAGKTGEFWLALSGLQNSPGNVSLVKFSQGEWGALQSVGEGSSAEVFTNQNGDLEAAWCAKNREISYLNGNNPVEVVSSTKCRNRPSIFKDQNGLTHLVYATDQWSDNFGTIRTGNALMEIIRLTEGWSEPAIVRQLFSDVQQEVAGSMGSDTLMAWIDALDGNQTLQYSTQPVYQCDKSALSDPLKAVLDVVQSGEFHPADYKSSLLREPISLGSSSCPTRRLSFMFYLLGIRQDMTNLQTCLKKHNTRSCFQICNGIKIRIILAQGAKWLGRYQRCTSR